MNRPLICAIGVCHRDVELACLWLRWTTFLTSLSQSGRPTLLVVATKRVTEKQLADISASIPITRFAWHQVKILLCPDEDESGYPKSASHLFLRTLEIAERESPNHAVLWCEADTVPMRPTWFGEISAEYDACGKPFLGAMVGKKNLQMSGIGIYPHDWRKLAPKIADVLNAPDLSQWGVGKGMPWDVFARDQIVPQMAESKCIYTVWKERQIRPTFLRDIPESCALFHQDKTGSTIREIAALRYPEFMSNLTSGRRFFFMNGHPSRVAAKGLRIKFSYHKFSAGFHRAAVCSDELTESDASAMATLVGQLGIREMTEEEFLKLTGRQAKSLPPARVRTIEPPEAPVIKVPPPKRTGPTVMPRYSISILTYTAIDAMKKCIASVLANSPAGEYELLLTANGSASAFKHFEQVRTAHPNVRVINNPTNEGFIAPNTRALEMATGEFMVFLNDDATVPPGWLEKLRQPFDEDRLIALTGPEGGCCVWNAAIQGGPGPKPEYIEFACAMGRTELLRKVGLFSPELVFAYNEDCDLSLRLREAGYRLQLVPFRITHVRGATSRAMPEIRRYQAANSAYLRKRWAHYFKVRTFSYVTLIRRRAAFGDVLLLTPIIRALHERNPNSPIWVETDCAEVLLGNPNVARVGPNLGVPAGALVVDLNMSYENAPLTHIVAAYEASAGVRVEARTLEFFPQKADKTFASSTLKGSDWIAVHPGPTTWSGKNWPMDRWQAVIDQLGGKVVLVGHESAPLNCQKDLRGKTTIGQLGAVLARCQLLITVDSLPLHVGQAVGTPTIGLFGVTDPQFIATDGSWFHGIKGTGPTAGQRHRTVGKTSVNDDGAAMATITVEEVVRVAQEKLCALQPTK